MPIHSGYDLFLLLLFADSGTEDKKVRGTTRLMKELFLLAMAPEFKSAASEAFSFSAYDFGPFSPDVPEGADLLASRGLLQVEEEALREEGNIAEVADDIAAEAASTGEPVPPIRRVTIYGLSPKGEKVAAALWERLTEAEKNRISEVKREFNELPLRILLKRVYQQYPDWTKKSKILWELGFGLGSSPGLEQFEHEE